MGACRGDQDRTGDGGVAFEQVVPQLAVAGFVPLAQFADLADQ